MPQKTWGALPVSKFGDTISNFKKPEFGSCHRIYHHVKKSPAVAGLFGYQLYMKKLCEVREELCKYGKRDLATLCLQSLGENFVVLDGVVDAFVCELERVVECGRRKGLG